MFIKDAPSFEPTTTAINRGNIGRLLNNQKILALNTQKITETLPRLVYNCTYGDGAPGAVPLLTSSKAQKTMYYEKLPNFY